MCGADARAARPAGLPWLEASLDDHPPAPIQGIRVDPVLGSRLARPRLARSCLLLLPAPEELHVDDAHDPVQERGREGILGAVVRAVRAVPRVLVLPSEILRPPLPCLVAG